MDEKAKEIIAPFSDWDIGGLRFGRVMAAIDAIMESKIERLTNEMKAEIQKLQIEKAFPPKTTNEGEDKEVCKEIEKEADLEIYAEVDEKEINDEEEQKLEESKNLEKEFKRTIGETLINKFSSEIYTLLDSEYYNDATWFVNLPSYTSKSVYEYCHALRKKLDKLINSVNNDSDSNSFYVTSRSENTKNLDSTAIVFNPKTCIINKASPSECNKFDNDDIKLIITEDNGTKNFFQFKWHRGYSIIECDNGNPNFMLFDPINCDYVLFYKSHKIMYVNCNSQNVKTDEKSRENHTKRFKEFSEDKEEWDKIQKEGKLLYCTEVKEDKEEVNESKLWGECSHPNDTKGKTEKDLSHLWYSAEVVKEDKRIKTRNKLKEIFGGVIMTITNKNEVNDNFTYSNSDLQTLKKNIRKYIRNFICEISESEPLYIYSNKNKQIDKPITCYRTRNYKIIPSSTTNNPWFDIKVICENCDISIPILFFDKSTYFLSVRNTDPKNKSYNFAIVNTKTKEFVIFTKDKFVYDGWELEITLDKDCLC